jgi:hypothetical protein
MDSNTIPLNRPKRARSLSMSARLQTLPVLLPVTLNLFKQQLDGLTARLSDVFLKSAEQSIRAEQSVRARNAFLLLRHSATVFQNMLSARLEFLLDREIAALQASRNAQWSDTAEGANWSHTVVDDIDLDALPNTDAFISALSELSATQLDALNARVAYILSLNAGDVFQNPVRPELFVHAFTQAWSEFDAPSLPILMELMTPDLFLDLAAIYRDINEELAHRWILPNIQQARFVAQRKFLRNGESLTANDPYLRGKLKKLFASNDGKIEENEPTNAERAGIVIDGADSDVDDAPHALSTAFPKTESTNESTPVDRRFFEYLNSIQRQNANQINSAAIDGAIDITALRQLLKDTPEGINLTQGDHNTVELLARIFEYVFNDPGIPDYLKNLIATLQIPTLKAALLDKEFFFSENHPARVLIETLAKSSIFLDANSVGADPLYLVIEGVVERVQHEFDEQIELFSDVVADLESFLADEELKTQQAITQPVAYALQQEKKREAREAAVKDVAKRIETGEVPGFLEEFLQDQWTRILAIAHGVKDEQPQALENALKTMDDVIWSLKPKNSAEERKELVSKLPAMLTLLNAWLNAIKWDEPQRVLFFSKLAERHAGIARAPLELSPRRQLEIAVNIAQRASERSFDRHKQAQKAMAGDASWEVVQSLEPGSWLEIEREDGVMARVKLAWASPQHTSFIFTTRQGTDAFALTAEELVQKLRDGTALQLVAASVVERVLLDMLRDKRM